MTSNRKYGIQRRILNKAIRRKQWLVWLIEENSAENNGANDNISQ